MLVSRLKKLPPVMADFIRSVGRKADQKHLSVYLVGGFVRDLFLGVDNFDVDFVVEGDAVAFAAEIAHQYDLKLARHHRFGTATLYGLEGFKVDMATARREIYEKPAALPTVTFGKIANDLSRRDFTINAMAICINIHEFGKLVDLYDGQSDLRQGHIRALYANSFIDDPTRILRAARFEQRFNFKIEKTTLKWINNAFRKKMLHLVQKHRLRDELVLMFQEQSPLKSLRRLYGLCGFSFIAPSLKYQKQMPVVFEEARKRFTWFKENFPHRRHCELYVMYMSLFFNQLDLHGLKKVIIDFAFHKTESSRMIDLRENFIKVSRELAGRNLSPSRIFRILEFLYHETIILVMILAKKKLVTQRAEGFLYIHNNVRLHLRGEDLKLLGIKPGPAYKKILYELLNAKIDAKVQTKDDEVNLAKEYL